MTSEVTARAYHRAMGVAESKEPDADLARRIAEDGCILRSVVGSTVHGLSNPGTDDRDEMGVCVEPREYVLGLRPFEHWVYRTQPEGAQSGPGDLDLVIYGVRKFCRLAMKGSPTVLLLLFVDGEHVVQRTELGAELQALAPAFLSRRTGNAFLGYLDAQRRGLLGDRHATRTRELSDAHGYDTKYAMHALRIAVQGIELIRPLPGARLPASLDGRRRLGLREPLFPRDANDLLVERRDRPARVPGRSQAVRIGQADRMTAPEARRRDSDRLVRLVDADAQRRDRFASRAQALRIGRGRDKHLREVDGADQPRRVLRVPVREERACLTVVRVGAVKGADQHVRVEDDLQRSSSSASSRSK